jgi:hypothetical protein
MKTWSRKITTVVLSGSLFITSNVTASGGRGVYEVTVTNVTQGEIFTPIMVASHPRGLRLFEFGEAAGNELAMLAEGGDAGPLSALLLSEGAHDVATAGDVLPPGGSVTLIVDVSAKNRYLSVASMLVPSNDAFFALNGVEGPRGHHTRTLFSPAYDAGSESNDELCVNIPGPPFICAGEGFNPADGEGYVHVHPGIQGVGDLVAANHDWRNPVAKISIRFTRK